MTSHAALAVLAADGCGRVPRTLRRRRRRDPCLSNRPSDEQRSAGAVSRRGGGFADRNNRGGERESWIKRTPLLLFRLKLSVVQMLIELQGEEGGALLWKMERDRGKEGSVVLSVYHPF